MKTMMDELKSLEQFEEYYKDEKTTVFVFSADWCPDCMFIKPFFPQLIDKYNNYRFIYIDYDKYPNLAKEWRIMGIPSFVKVRNGSEIDRFVSKLRKTQTEIDQFLSE
jgi:thiol-disulfide isomerase/thioredoxin